MPSDDESSPGSCSIPACYSLSISLFFLSLIPFYHSPSVPCVLPVPLNISHLGKKDLVFQGSRQAFMPFHLLMEITLINWHVRCKCMPCLDSNVFYIMDIAYINQLKSTLHQMRVHSGTAALHRFSVRRLSATHTGCVLSAAWCRTTAVARLGRSYSN